MLNNFNENLVESVGVCKYVKERQREKENEKKILQYMYNKASCGHFVN